MPSDNATPFDAVPSATPQIRRMRGLPRVAVWVFMIAAPWVVLVQAARLFS